MADFPNIGHVVITIKDLEISRPWYSKLFGSEPVLEEDTGPFIHCVWVLPNGQLISLHQFHEPLPDEFDPRRRGLDHLSFGVTKRAELQDWAKRLDEMGIRHGDVVDASYGSGLTFFDPDDIQLEFFAPPGT
jgi:catechol 2,3-dioxygenase-like lactoylglutathione lyase family enzyme